MLSERRQFTVLTPPPPRLHPCVEKEICPIHIDHNNVWSRAQTHLWIAHASRIRCYKNKETRTILEHPVGMFQSCLLTSLTLTITPKETHNW